MKHECETGALQPEFFTKTGPAQPLFDKIAEESLRILPTFPYFCNKIVVMTTRELKGKALEMLAAVHDSDSLEQILAFIEQFVPSESLDIFAADDDALTAEQKVELSRIIQKSRYQNALFLTKKEFFKGYEQWLKQ